mmetsp:Transcript_4718/g.6909  ORF Transcript_4718/g.6909 Transcript_4718/m.6909 type:complete len:101 (+) Transcript_4718:387-689(+)
MVVLALFFGHLLKEWLAPSDDVVPLALVGVPEEHPCAEEEARVRLGSGEVLGNLRVHAERGLPELFVENLLCGREGQGAGGRLLFWVEEALDAPRAAVVP